MDFTRFFRRTGQLHDQLDMSIALLLIPLCLMALKLHGVDLVPDIVIDASVMFGYALLTLMSLYSKSAFLESIPIYFGFIHAAFSVEMLTIIATCVIMGLLIVLVVGLGPQCFTLAEASVITQIFSLTLFYMAIKLPLDQELYSSGNVLTVSMVILFTVISMLILSYPLLMLHIRRMVLANDEKLVTSFSIIFHGIIGIGSLLVADTVSKFAIAEPKVSIISWLVEFIFISNQMHLLMIIWWMVCLLAATMVPLFKPKWLSQEPGGKWQRIKLDFGRKFFHILAFMLFVPAAKYAPDLLTLAYSISSCLFLVIEVVRIFDIWIPYADSRELDQILRQFTENPKKKKDQDSTDTVLTENRIASPVTGRNWDHGPLILSHFYLLAAAALPHWFTCILEHMDDILLLKTVGIVMIGVGDTAAAIFGHLFGRHRWPNRKKTIEGSLGFFVCSFITCQLLSSQNDAYTLMRNGIVCAGSALLEALSYQNDNLLLSMWSCAALLILTFR